MDVATTVARARELCGVLPRPLGFVPTMGALHDGHFELVRRARAQCASLAASVFVNPLQFAENEDLDRYPRDFEGDRAGLSAAGVDVLFAPSTAEMYAPGFSTKIDVGAVGAAYEGSIRHTHFAGVATVVVKLLNIVRPDVLYLGQKDAQQTAVLRKAVRDLDIPVRVEIVPTAREDDGLARSSRNVYLTEQQREHAPSLHRAVKTFRDAMTSGAEKSDAMRAARAELWAEATLDYLDLVDADTFAPIDRLRPPAFVVAAARFGATRLLDNEWIDE